MRPTTFTTTGMLALACWAMPASAGLTFSAGDHDILPAAGQTIDLFVTGDTTIGSFDLALQVGNAPGAPLVTNIDLESGIFALNNSGQSDAGSDALRKFYSIITDEGEVLADGLLVRLTLDATGVPEGTYSLLVRQINTPAGYMSSVFANAESGTVAAELVNGTITVVPEPVLAGFAVLAALPLARRRRV